MGELVAGAGEFFGGTLAIAIVFAIAMMVSLIISVANYMHIGSIPLVGGAIMGALRFVGGALDNLLGWLWQHCNPVNLAVATFGYLGASLTNNMTSVIAAQYGAVSRVTTVSIPNAIATARSTTIAYYSASIAYADAKYASSVVLAYQLYNYAIATINAETATWGASLQGVKEQIVTSADNTLKAAQASALGLVQSTQGWLVQQLDKLHAYVDSTDAARGATTQGEIGSGLDALGKTLAPEIAGAAAIGAAAAAAFETWKNECGNGLCNNLSGFGNEIAALLNLISDGALVALIAGAVTDPQGTVDFVVNDIAGAATDAIDTAASLVGLNLAA